MIPRSEWLPRLMRKHPEVLELRERFRPLHREESFGRSINASKTEVKETFSLPATLQLIYQFLKEHHLDKTLKQLQKESHMQCTYLKPTINEMPVQSLFSMRHRY
jgi:hypothetical protein